MGIQAFINLETLPKSVAANFEYEDSEYEDNDGNVEVYTTSWVTLTAADGTSRVFNGAGAGSAWVDVNHWGSNRGNYLPWLNANAIPYTEG